MSDPFLKQIQLAGHELKHRIAMAPMTRFRASDAGVVSANASEYYSERSTLGGFLISEGLVPHPRGRGFRKSPGICTAEQVEAWKPVTAAVKAKGAVFFAQLWHVGRITVPSQTGGLPALSAISVPLPGIHTQFQKGLEEPYVTGEAMTLAQIEEVTHQFVQAAQNAIAAGFDGIEIHGENGYIFDTFVHSNINDHTDDCGCYRIYNWGKQNGNSNCSILHLKHAGDENRVETFSAYSEALESRDLAYVHMVEPRYDQAVSGTAFHNQRVIDAERYDDLLPREEDTLWPFKKILEKTIVVTAGGYSAESAREALLEGRTDIVAFGRPFTSNPDLVARLLHNLPLTSYDRSTFYTNEMERYLGWKSAKV